MTALKFATAVLVVLVALPLVGQDKAAPPKPTADAKAAEMTEDVEVLRLLLNKSFGFPQRGVHHPGGITIPQLGVVDNTAIQDNTAVRNNTTIRDNTTINLWPAPFPTARESAGRSPASFDGVYLRGHGVAYTIRVSGLAPESLPPHEKAAGLVVTCQHCHATDAVEKFHLTAGANLSKPQTDWEKARDELRGVSPKVDADGGRMNLAVMCAPGNLTETVTKVLAANGRHLRHLTADESVSVIVTYDGVSGPAHDRATGTMADPTLWTPPAPVGTKFGFTPDEAKQLVLGDLHLKQGKHADAVKAYQSALARYPAPLTTITAPKEMKAADLTAAIKELHASVTGAYKSLAQAHIAAGNLDEARRALEVAQKLEIKLAAGGGKPAGPPVPAKIILTAKKAHLDAAEKLSPADFRKGVTVETVGLAGVKK